MSPAGLRGLLGTDRDLHLQGHHPLLRLWLLHLTLPHVPWTECVPLDSYVDILTPNVMALGGGAFGRRLSHEGGVLRDGISALIKWVPESLLFLPCEDTMRNRPSVTQKMPSLEPDPAGTLILDFQAPEL